MVKQLQNILIAYSTNQPIVQTASWVIGEYQNDDTSCVESMERILKLPQTTVETRGYLITALSKLSIRFNMIQEIGSILVPYQKSNSLEIQQRAGEMVRILTKPNLAAQVLATIEDQPQTQTEESEMSIPTTGGSGNFSSNNNKNQPNQTDDQIETFRPCVAKLLNSSNHSIVCTGINLAIQMLTVNPQLCSSWKGFSNPFAKILKTLFEVRPGREYDFNSFNDPFLQIRILRCLSVLKSPSDELDDILTTIITGLDCRRNTARGILLQAVETISSCAKKSSLRGLAINQIGRLFTYNTNLVYYTALSAFSRFLFADGAIIDRGSPDSQALQRYKSQIVQCLDHPDPSIRRRALDVISALINEDNIETLYPEIMSYMKLVDTEFKNEMGQVNSIF